MKLETWFDPLEMFRQITPNGIVNKEIGSEKVEINGVASTGKEDLSEQTEEEKAALGAVMSSAVNGEESDRMDLSKVSVVSGEGTERTDSPQDFLVNGEETELIDPLKALAVNGDGTERKESAEAPDLSLGMKSSTEPDYIDEHLAKASDQVHPHLKDMEMAVQPAAGEAVAAPADSQETKMTYEEMSKVTSAECPFLMNRE